MPHFDFRVRFAGFPGPRPSIAFHFAGFSQDVLRDRDLQRPDLAEHGIDLSHDGVAEISSAVHELLANVFTLYLKTKEFHWHVSGRHFRDYHLLLDEHGDQLFAMTDRIAGRARKIGGTTLHSISDISAHQRLADNDQEVVSPDDMLGELLADSQRLTGFLRVTLGRRKDAATTSMIEVWIDQTEGRPWFLAEIVGRMWPTRSHHEILLTQCSGDGKSQDVAMQTLLARHVSAWPLLNWDMPLGRCVALLRVDMGTSKAPNRRERSRHKPNIHQRLFFITTVLLGNGIAQQTANPSSSPFVPDTPGASHASTDLRVSGPDSAGWLYPITTLTSVRLEVE